MRVHLRGEFIIGLSRDERFSGIIVAHDSQFSSMRKSDTMTRHGMIEHIRYRSRVEAAGEKSPRFATIARSRDPRLASAFARGSYFLDGREGGGDSSFPPMRSAL